jgi:tripartite-type tricarboxylate transporter receptor subunit TctC
LPLIAAAAGLFVVLGGGGTIAAVTYSRQPTTTAQTPVAPSMALPEGRKDLPPETTARTEPSGALATPVPVDVPSALPSSRVPSSEGRVPKAGVAARPPKGVPNTAGQPTPPVAAPPTGKKPPDDLSDIGRR